MKYLIRDLVQKTHIPADSIRFYEKKGLLKAPYRGGNNYRYYDDEGLNQLIFIGHCREVGMSLKEIAVLTQLLSQPEQCCNAVNQALIEHLQHVNTKIVQLNTVKQQLEQLIQSCDATVAIDHCKIIEQLKKGFYE